MLILTLFLCVVEARFFYSKERNFEKMTTDIKKDIETDIKDNIKGMYYTPLGYFFFGYTTQE